jgi:hypothetical protein
VWSQRHKKRLSQGLDDSVKSLYSPIHRSKEFYPFKGSIVKSTRTTTNHRPAQGLAAFVRCCPVVTMASMSMGLVDSPLDRAERTIDPGEGSA